MVLLAQPLNLGEDMTLVTSVPVVNLDDHFLSGFVTFTCHPKEVV